MGPGSSLRSARDDGIHSPPFSSPRAPARKPAPCLRPEISFRRFGRLPARLPPEFLARKTGTAGFEKKSHDRRAAMTRDYSATLFLPKTDFPMRAGLPQKEPELLDRWQRLGLYGRLRRAAKGRPKFILHDGPPYANAHIHMGTALNKILKDVVTRSQQMLGFDSNYVPGWDCHGLPIEWKIEEQYRAKGQDKDSVPVNEFRQQCREFAQHWIGVQMTEFKRLGVEGDWEHYY